MARVFAALILILCCTGILYADLQKDIEDANQRLTEAFNRQDAEAVSQLYLEDCMVMPAGSEIVQGRKDVKKFYEDNFKTGMASVMIQIDEVGPPDATDTLFERSHISYFDAKGNVMDLAKQLVIWKKTLAGEWRISKHLFSTNLDPAQTQREEVLKRELTAQNRHYEEMWGNMDAAGLAACFTPDGMVYETGFDVFQGEAVLPMLQMLFDMGFGGITLEMQDAHYIGSTEAMAFERGFFKLRDPKGNIINRGKFLWLLKKIDGHWKVYVDSYNSSLSPSQLPEHTEF